MYILHVLTMAMTGNLGSKVLAQTRSRCDLGMAFSQCPSHRVQSSWNLLDRRQ